MPPKGAKKSPGEKEDKPKKKTTPAGEKKDGSPQEEVPGRPKCRKELKIPKSLGDEQGTLLDVEEVVGWALHGRLDCDYPENSKIVRIFTSSTFTGKARQWNWVDSVADVLKKRMWHSINYPLTNNKSLEIGKHSETFSFSFYY